MTSWVSLAIKESATEHFRYNNSNFRKQTSCGVGKKQQR